MAGGATTPPQLSQPTEYTGVQCETSDGKRNVRRVFQKTHIIVQKSLGERSDSFGMEIKRFLVNEAGETLSLMENPYAGVYLTEEEWRIIFGRMLGKSAD